MTGYLDRLAQRLGLPLPFRVVVDARTVHGASGGVLQWVIGLAASLSRLDGGREEYLFLVNDGDSSWLAPSLGGNARLLVHASSPASVAGPPAFASAQAPARPPAGGLRRLVRRSIRWVRRRLGSRPSRRGPIVSPYHETIARAGAHVMHFTTPSGFRTGVPSVYQPWDLQHRHLPEFFADIDLEARDATYRRFCAQATRIVVATSWVKADVTASYGVPPERIAVVNVPPPTITYPAPTAAEEAETIDALGLPARFLFYPAVTWGHKNHERLLEALRELRSRGHEVPLVCSGHRNARYPALLERVVELGLDDLVSFVGFVTPVQLQVLYRRATALVFPSLYEGWGLPIVEAFAADLPVICSTATSLPDLVGDAAVLVDPLDTSSIAKAIQLVWTDRDLRARLVERGRARIARFDWGHTARLMRALYRQAGGRRLTAEDRALIAAPPLV